MRFQTIGLLALFIIVIGAVGIYKSEDLSMPNQDNEDMSKLIIQEETLQAFAIRKNVKADELVLRDSFELHKMMRNMDDSKQYITDADEDFFEPEIFILKEPMQKGDFVSLENLVSLKNKQFTEIVLDVDRGTIENFSSGFFDVYWHFNSSERNKNSRKVKLFSKNVFVRPVNESSDNKQRSISIKRERENLEPVVFSVKDSVVERYLQADQLGYFKLVSVTQKNINLENYSTLEVDSSKEIQANDISSSYKYDVNFIK